MTLKLEGAFTALVTPFRGGELDPRALDDLVDFQVDAGIAGLVPCGTTGEAPALSDAERLSVWKHVVQRVRGRVPVVAGTGTNNTRESIERTRAAREAGADAAMLVLPYYNKPTQRGVAAHVQAVHDATDLPLVLYSVPSRGTPDLLPETMAQIAASCPRVIALKEASGNILRCQSVFAALGDRIQVLCGDDALTVGMMAVGARGVISVTSNVAPAQVATVCRTMLAGDLAGARRRHQALLPLHEALFLETNPGPIKAALARNGRIAPEVRLPLVWPGERTIQAIGDALKASGVA